MSDNLGVNRGRGGLVGGFNGIDSSLLFFFLILVIIFNNCGDSKGGRGIGGVDDSLLFFFLLLVIIFCGDDLWC